MADDSNDSSSETTSETSNDDQSADRGDQEALGAKRRNMRTNAGSKGDEVEKGAGKNPSREERSPSAEDEYVPRSVRSDTDTSDTASSQGEGGKDNNDNNSNSSDE